jgi:6-phosphogluconolactonase
MDVHVVAPTEVGATAANLMGATLDAAVAARGHATLALSGGTTPAAMLTELATQSLPWERIHVFQVDERVAPDGSSERNLSVLRACLIDRIVLPEENLHPMPVTEADLDAAADRYAARLHLHAGDPPTLDVVHLGLGIDGHTASLVPGDEVLEVDDRDVTTAGFYRSHWRMTMTLPVLSRARWALWVVTGGGKAGVVQQLVAGDEAIPAARVRAGQSVLVADHAAAALLPPTRQQSRVTRPGGP